MLLGWLGASQCELIGCCLWPNAGAVAKVEGQTKDEDGDADGDGQLQLARMSGRLDERRQSANTPCQRFGLASMHSKKSLGTTKIRYYLEYVKEYYT